MKVKMCSALIIGHRFVKRCLKYKLEYNLDGYDHVFFLGVSGMKLEGLENEIDIIEHLGVKLVIIDIGSNDLCKLRYDSSYFAQKAIEIA